MSKAGRDATARAVPLATAVRYALGAASLLLLATGCVALFQDKGGLGTVGLIVSGMVAGYLAASGDRLVGVSTSGLSFAERLVQSAVDGDLGIRAQTNLVDLIEEVEQGVPLRGTASASVAVPNTIQERAKIVTRARKGELLEQLCDELEIPRADLGVGSSLPSGVFKEAAKRFGVSPSMSMPGIAKSLIVMSGGDWNESFASIGSTVTRSGLEALLGAVRRLNESKDPDHNLAADS